jgi:crotonobetainyl-CoA:carnitine CoA-transferase CaiB-like acyl-CoA transferase
VPYLDYLAGCFAAMAVLKLLEQREAHGGGGSACVPLWGVAAQVAPSSPLDWDVAGWLRSVTGVSEQTGDAPRAHLPGAPWSFTGVPDVQRRPAPTLGQHSAEVLREAEVPEALIQRLSSSQAPVR